MYVEAAEAALTAFEHRVTIARLLRRLAFVLTRGRTRLLVIGAGGTGKTTLSLQLEGEREDKSPGSYVVSIVREQRALEEVPLGCTIVMPGQPTRRTEVQHRGFVRDLLKRSRIDGVIHVASYGYHALDTGSFREHRHRPSTSCSAEEFMEAHLPAARQEEVDVLHELRRHLEDCEHPPWIMTVVTKQDLWWEQRVAARDYYENGPYADALDEIRLDLGRGRVSHLLASVSLEIVNMRTINGELLAQTIGGYDEQIQAANLALLEQQLRSLLGVKDAGGQ